MSAHFHKLHCGPRALMLIAERIGRPIDPDALWEQFGAGLEASDGAVAISTMLDMARHFGIARKIDVTHDIDRAGQSMGHTNIAGVLVTCERWPTDDEGMRDVQHLMVLHQIAHDIETGQRFVFLKSAEAGQDAVVLRIAESSLVPMMSCFLLLYDIP